MPEDINTARWESTTGLRRDRPGEHEAAGHEAVKIEAEYASLSTKISLDKCLLVEVTYQLERAQRHPSKEVHRRRMVHKHGLLSVVITRRKLTPTIVSPLPFGQFNV